MLIWQCYRCDVSSTCDTRFRPEGFHGFVCPQLIRHGRTNAQFGVKHFQIFECIKFSLHVLSWGTIRFSCPSSFGCLCQSGAVTLKPAGTADGWRGWTLFSNVSCVVNNRKTNSRWDSYRPPSWKPALFSSPQQTDWLTGLIIPESQWALMYCSFTCLNHFILKFGTCFWRKSKLKCPVLIWSTSILVPL